MFVAENIEAVCLEITNPKSKPILVTTVYCPPNSNVDFTDELEKYFHILDEQDKELIFTGDLNCDFSPPDLLSHSRRILDILELFQLKQVITDATRITSTTKSLLDIIVKETKKAAKGIGMLRRSKHLFDKNTLETIYNAFVLPHFDYCALVWNNCSKTLQTKLQKLQNKAGRIITGDCFRTPSDTVRNKPSWDILEARRENQLENLMTQIMKGNSDNYLRDLFTIRNNETYKLRSNNHALHLP